MNELLHKYPDLQRLTNSKIVSRETILLFVNYIELLKKWQNTINLVSASTLNDIWKRHIIDSLQLLEYMEESENVLDVGSGAGLPGLILAIAGVKNMTLVESDTRKSAFLREAAQFAQGNVNIINQRVEKVSLREFQTITARAFAPIERMLESLSKTLEIRHKLLLLKGKTYKKELEDAQKTWNFDYSVIPSITDNESVILTLTSCQKR